MRINRFYNLHQGEWGKVFLLSTHTALAASVLVIVQSSTSALFLERYGSNLLPYLFSLQAVFLVTMSLAHSSLLGKIARSTESAGVMAILFAAVVISRLLLLFHHGWSIFVICVLLQTLVDILYVVSSTMVIAHLNVRESKRLLPIINVGGTVGSIVSGLLVAGLTQLLGTENLLLLVIPLLGAMVMTGKRSMNDDDYLKFRPTDNGSLLPEENAVKRLKKAVVGVVSDKMLILIAIMIVSGIIASTFVDYQLKSLLKATFSKDEIAVFLGEFFTVLNLAVLSMQLVLSGRIISSLGLTLNLLLMPAFVLLGSVAFVFMPVMGVVAGTRFMENVTKFTVFKSTYSLLFMAYTPLQQARFKIAVDGVIKPLAVLAASSLMILCSQFLELRYLSVIGVMATTISMISILGMKKLYVEKLQDSLSNRGVRLQDGRVMDELMSRQGRDLTQRLLNSPEKKELIFCLQLSREYGIPLQVEELQTVIKCEDEEIITELLKTLQQDGNPHCEQQILSLLRKTTSDKILAECIKTLRYLKTEEYAAAPVTVSAKSSHDRVEAEVRLYVAFCGGKNAFEALISELISSVVDATDEKLSIITYMMGETEDLRLSRFLPPLFVHSHRGVKREALRAAGKIYTPSILPFVVSALEDPETKFMATDVLARYGHDAVEELRCAFVSAETNESFREAIVATLGKIRTPSSHDLLITMLSLEDHRLRQKIVAALGKFTGKIAVSHRSGSMVIQVVKEELKVGVELQALLYVAFRGGERNSGKIDFLRNEITLKLNGWKECLFKILPVIYDREVIKKTYYNCLSSHGEDHANSMELLENLLDNDIKNVFMLLVENMPNVARFGRLEGVADFQKIADKEWYAAFAQSPYLWLGSMAHWIESDISPMKVSPGEAIMHESLETIFFLKSLELFSSLSGEQLKPVADLLSKVEYNADFRIFGEGDAGDSLYLILSGEVSVEKESGNIAVLKKGDHFGEMALFDDAPRSATVITMTPCRMLKMDKEEFHEILDEYPGISRAIITTLAKRLRALL